MPGVPASVTNATDCPAWSSVRIGSAWLASLWWCHDAAELELAADRFTGRATPRAPLPERRLVEATLHQVVFWRSMAELAWRLVER